MISLKPKKATPISFLPTEEVEQIKLVNYLDLLIAKGRPINKYTAIPNSTFTTSWKQKIKNKNTGLKPGLPDMFFIIKNKPLFIEMKRQKGGVVSKEQQSWILALNSCGIPTKVCEGFNEAKALIDKYLIL